MARISHGAETKKRAKRLLEVLLAYANDALDCDETALDALRLNIQIRWQSEIRLVVRTKVRFLQTLTSLQAGQNPLNAEQIKEALRRFADFLEILEDNRSTRAGSENWHFTLNLWYPCHNIEDNLQRFDREWENRRQKTSTSSHTSPSSPWKDICREMLQNQRRLTTNP
jgi:Effector-associated domain 4